MRRNNENLADIKDLSVCLHDHTPAPSKAVEDVNFHHSAEDRGPAWSANPVPSKSVTALHHQAAAGTYHLRVPSLPVKGRR